MQIAKHQLNQPLNAFSNYDQIFNGPITDPEHVVYIMGTRVSRGSDPRIRAAESTPLRNWRFKVLPA